MEHSRTSGPFLISLGNQETRYGTSQGKACLQRIPIRSEAYKETPKAAWHRLQGRRRTDPCAGTLRVNEAPSINI